MKDLLDWSLEHPLATFLWFLMALFTLETVGEIVCLAIAAFRRRSK